MKDIKYVMLLTFIFCLLTGTAVAQQQLPDFSMETLKGDRIQTQAILKDRVPVVVSFWTTACKPCIQELDAFAENWKLWQSQVKFKLLAVSIDDTRTASRVRPLVRSRDWPFYILLDKNQEFKRALQVNMIPQLFVLDENGKVIYSRVGYYPGNEIEVLEILKGLK
ncbi:peroxiredoxin family protein [Sphingobacterium sp. LRF_L2]|uniref:peroxiredoxin family protein n=1 Tax=Sphingobacterium sp. LRF_L2 TaxID=3369421 RepID=UPI003F5F672B